MYDFEIIILCTIKSKGSNPSSCGTIFPKVAVFVFVLECCVYDQIKSRMFVFVFVLCCGLYQLCEQKFLEKSTPPPLSTLVGVGVVLFGWEIALRPSHPSISNDSLHRSTLNCSTKLLKSSFEENGTLFHLSLHVVLLTITVRYRSRVGCGRNEQQQQLEQETLHGGKII